MDKQFVLKTVLCNNYYDIDDLRYNKNVDILLSKEELKKFLEIKDGFLDENNNNFIKLPLKTFNSKYCFYVNGEYLKNAYTEYLSLLMDDFETTNDFFFNRHKDDIIMSRIFSEVEGTLNVENVPTTHKRVKEIFESENLTDKNDIIVKNMQNAINYIMQKKPKFNKENLLKLYKILSKDCLEKNDTLKDGCYYRDDSVYVGGYEGANEKEIDNMMDSLFAFVNDENSLKQHKILLPLICHYYILYVHPYFDYNGRTARMVSFWISVIYGIKEAPIFISEAINEEKNKYYKAISNTRNSNNDLTFFLGYILEIAVKYGLVYKNVEHIKNELLLQGEFLTPSEQLYLKKIIIHNSCGYFNHKLFLKYINSNMSLTGCIKILNSLTNYNILIKSENKKGETIYQVNQDLLKYKI